MIIADTHCDTLCFSQDQQIPLRKNTLHLDFEGMKQYEHYTQVFACFIDPIYRSTARERCLRLIDTFYEELGKNRDIAQVCTAWTDLCQARTAGKIAAFLSIEGGEPIESLADLRLFYRLGVRMMALTWNPQNQLATGVEGDQNRGVTQLGRRVIREMNRLGMAVDVSHMNERSFWDAAEITQKPLIATHSNSRRLCAHPRNLTDEQFCAVRDMGGYVGINFYPLFLADSGRVQIDDLIRHIEHFLSLSGEAVVGLGSDFDGVDSLPEGISGVRSMETLFNRMAQLGYSEALLEKLAHGNFDRMIRQL